MYELKLTCVTICINLVTDRNLVSVCQLYSRLMVNDNLQT